MIVKIGGGHMKFSSLFISFFALLILFSFQIGAAQNRPKKSVAPMCRFMAQEKKPEPPMAEGHACKVPKGKGSNKGVCKHCGCRMRFSDEDAEKTCTYCKCGVKHKECLM